MAGAAIRSAGVRGIRVSRCAAVVLAALLVPALAACGNNSRRSEFAFDGHYYRAKARKAGDVREDFEVTVRPVAASLEGAREAGRHAGISYCVEDYGNSEILWANGPDAPAGALVIDGDTLILRGRCKG